MATADPSLTFAAAFKAFCEQTESKTPFNAGCHAFLVYNQTEESWKRLIILYILYALYADQPLERNPFLTFFLEFVTSDEHCEDKLERCFVNCILDGSIVKVQQVTPKQLCDSDENLRLLSLHESPPPKERLKELEKSVARLINDTWQEHEEEKDTLRAIQLIHEACTRTLTIPEQQFVQKAFASQELASTCGLGPSDVRQIVDMNHLLALQVVQAFLMQPNGKEYLEALAQVPVTSNCIEVVHHLLTLGEPVDDDFLHMYISAMIRSDAVLPGGSQRDKLARLVAKFIQSLLDKRIIRIEDYIIEIQSFCINYFRLKDVATLFRVASQEAQRMGIEPVESRWRPLEHEYV